MFKEKLMKRLDKKGAKDLDPLERDAKMNIAKELSRQAGSLLGDKIHPMKKVEVASDSSEGLKHGLHKAEDIVEGAEEDLGADLDKDGEEGESAAHKMKVLGGGAEHDAGPAEGSVEEEAGESPGEESQEDVDAEHADHSPEEIDAKIQKLMALKHKKESGRA